MREWPYKTDESGRPRRFLDHRESVSWAAVRVVKFAGSSLAFGVVMLLFFYPQDLRPVVILPVIAVVLVLCAAAVVAIHLYFVFAGGVMDRDERQRYLESLLEADH